MKMQKYFKPIAIIFLAAMGMGIVSYTALGFVGPGAMFSFHTETNATNATVPQAPSVPIIPVDILVNASVKGNPSFKPDPVSAPKGDIIEWTNKDIAAHTVTSAPDGTLFDSSIIASGKTYQLDTAKLDIKEYDYLCTVHPWMTGKIEITAPTKPIIANVTISEGASKQSNGQKYFDPQEISVKVGTTVVWTNQDSVAHTVSSGDPNAGQTNAFDSGLIKAGATFQHKFDSAGTNPYFCTVHPWMTGKVTVG